MSSKITNVKIEDVEWSEFRRDFETHAERVQRIEGSVDSVAKDLTSSRSQISSAVGNAIKLSALLVVSVEILFGSLLIVMILKDSPKSFHADTHGFSIENSK